MDAAPQLICLFVAFWTAVLGFARDPTSHGFERRLVLGLAVGAWLSHAGWALLYLDRLGGYPWVPRASGFCVLFFPLGPLLLAPWTHGATTRERYLCSCFAPLPLALAVARLGYLAAGCCAGLPLDLTGSGWPARHPIALYEAAGLLVLGGCTRRLDRRWRAPGVLAGTALLRLALEPWRALPPLGEPLVAVELLAGLWVAGAVGLALSAWVPPPRGPEEEPRRAPRRTGARATAWWRGGWPSRMALRPRRIAAGGPSARDP